MKIRSAVPFALTISCALAACQSPPAAPKRADPVRLVKAPSNLADLGVAGYLLHPALTADAPGLIEFIDANRASIGKMTSSTVHTETSVVTTMTIEGIGNAEPLVITDETVGDGAMTRAIIRRGAETTTFEHDAGGMFLVVADGRIPIDDEHEVELAAALPHTGFDPRFRAFATLSQDPHLAQAPELKGVFSHKSPLCTSILAGLAGACVTVCMAAASPALPVTLPACLVVCGVGALDWYYCQGQASEAVNDAQCDLNHETGKIGRADVTEHHCIQQCDQSRCDGFCKGQPHGRNGYCSDDNCLCNFFSGEDDDSGGDGTSGDDTSADDTSADGTDGGGGCTGWQTWCDCIGAYNEYHGLVCSETPDRLIDDCWNSCN